MNLSGPTDGPAPPPRGPLEPAGGGLPRLGGGRRGATEVRPPQSRSPSKIEMDPMQTSAHLLGVETDVMDRHFERRVPIQVLQLHQVHPRPVRDPTERPSQIVVRDVDPLSRKA